MLLTLNTKTLKINSGICPSSWKGKIKTGVTAHLYAVCLFQGGILHNWLQNTSRDTNSTPCPSAFSRNENTRGRSIIPIGIPSVKTVRESCLTAWVVCGGSQIGPAYCKGALVAAAKVWSGEIVTASGSWMVREETFLNMTKFLAFQVWHPF